MRPKSKVWINFIKIDLKTSKCKLCGKIIMTSGNTKNMWNHIQRQHDLVVPSSSSTFGIHDAHDLEMEFEADNNGLLPCDVFDIAFQLYSPV